MKQQTSGKLEEEKDEEEEEEREWEVVIVQN